MFNIPRIVCDSNANWNVNEMGVKKEEKRKEKFLEDSRILRDGKFVWTKEEISMKKNGR